MDLQGVDVGAPDGFAAGCAWIEGEYLPIGEARMPILDVGFVRSDLTYDVASVWKGSFFRLEDHLDRLIRGCGRINLDLPLIREEIREIMFETVRRSGLRESYVEVVVTRGVPGPGERDPRMWKPRIYIYAIPFVWIVRPELQVPGTDVIVARDTRRIPTGSVDPTVKNFHWGDLTRGLYEAYDRDAWLPILTDGDGLITEGPGFNVFVVKDGAMSTAARGVLEGITRKTVLEIATEMDIEASVGDVPVTSLYDADELFLSSTAGGIMPVANLDGAPVGAGSPGPLTAKIKDRYWDLHDDPRYRRPVDYPSD